MKRHITSVADLGTLVRATRKSAGMRLDDLAATANLSKQFVNDVELGKPGVQLGKVFQLLQELGVYLLVDVPDEVDSRVADAKNQIEKTAQRREARSLASRRKSSL